MDLNQTPVNRSSTFYPKKVQNKKTEKIIKQFISIFLILALIGSAFVFGIFIGTELVSSEKKIISITGKESGKPEELDFSLFWDSWKTIEEKYGFSEAIDRQNMIYGAIEGLIRSLGDPHSTFLNPEDSKKFQDDISGTFEGIGVEIGIRKGVLTVISPLKNTPADRAGLRAGDKILKIDEELTTDLTLDEAVSLIRGPKNTEVTLTIYREDWGKTQEIKIIRGVIEVSSLDWEILEGNIAYIHLYQFTEKASSDFKNIIPQVLNSDADRIILDLRNNPGGILNIAVDIAGHFLEKNKLVAIEDFTDDKNDEEYNTTKTGEFINLPLVILINQGSASASEILAEALRYNRGVKLIGEKSFGKGSVQELFTLKDGSTIKLSVARWLTPSGLSINDRGLDPDIEVELIEEDFEAGRDPQLERAIEIIKSL